MEKFEKKLENAEEMATAETGKTTQSESNIEPTFSEETGESACKRSRLTGSDEEIVEKKDGEKVTTSTALDLQKGGAVTLSVGPRHFKKIPIFIVDYHNEVLEFIYRCLGSRHLPLQNNTLLHFDAHPDMVMSREIPASSCYDKEAMLNELSIENWIMPACYAGIFNRVIWMKNSWCNQMPVGQHNFKVGHNEDIVCVDCNLEYFVSEGNYCPTTELEQAKDVELHVVNADAEEPPNPKQLLSNYNYILDIDLDFFSTTNPFLEIYKEANCYAQLIDIFHFESDAEDVLATTEKRQDQLDALRDIFEHLEEKRNFEGMQKPPPDVVSEEIFEKIVNLADSLHKVYKDDEIDWLLIYDSGTTTDGLPHHISSDADLALYYTQFKEFLKNVPHTPVFITISCSSEDDYCPREQVTLIQDKVIDILQEVFGDKVLKRPIYRYLNEEWDVMKL